MIGHLKKHGAAGMRTLKEVRVDADGDGVVETPVKVGAGNEAGQKPPARMGRRSSLPPRRR